MRVSYVQSNSNYVDSEFSTIYVQAVLCDDFYASQIENGDEFWTSFSDKGLLCPNTTQITINNSDKYQSKFYM